MAEIITANHRHIFPLGGQGCWCGAHGCQWMGMKDGGGIAFCDELIEEGTQYYRAHQGGSFFTRGYLLNG